MLWRNLWVFQVTKVYTFIWVYTFSGFMIFQLIYQLMVVFFVTNFKALINSNQQPLTRNIHLYFSEYYILHLDNVLYSVYEPRISRITVTNWFLAFPSLIDFFSNPLQQIILCWKLFLVVNCSRWSIETITFCFLI